ncbi:Mobile element protein [uncultured Gammaproteobacteria bacterium]|nr:Mobile element protein [uncultured Gammaproteobacteria bacterium]
MNEKEVFKATDLMNNRPRKCLGYKTPFEVFAELTGKDYFFKLKCCTYRLNSTLVFCKTKAIKI